MSLEKVVENKKNVFVKFSDKMAESKLCKSAFFGAYFAANAAVLYEPLIAIVSDFALLATLVIAYYASNKYYKKMQRNILNNRQT